MGERLPSRIEMEPVGPEFEPQRCLLEALNNHTSPFESLRPFVQAGDIYGEAELGCYCGGNCGTSYREMHFDGVDHPTLEFDGREELIICPRGNVFEIE